MIKLVGIDVGGTFTDLFFSSGNDPSTTRVLKVPSTPDDPSRGLIDALQAADIDLDRLDAILHGTTIATNAVIERRGAKCALITTDGFRDILELGRRDRPRMYGMTGVQQPMIPRRMRWEVAERMDHTGAVLTPLDEMRLRKIGEALAAEGVESIAVAFLHSYANPVHERRAGEILRAISSDWQVVLSSDVVREYYEFERTSTAVVQAFLQPLVSRYVRELSSKLAALDFDRQTLVMQSNGGLVPLPRLSDKAAQIVRSGPAAGVMAAAAIAGAAGFRNVITGDMGGTSYDVAVIIDGNPRIAETTELDFRVPLRLPMIDVHTIGAGGGSIAHVDRAGVLQVGPHSAGALPGPVCFGRGGTQPTVADANAVLGRINPDRPIGLKHLDRLDIEGARASMARLGDQLGLGVQQTAEAILSVVNHIMARRTRLLTIEQGLDPREFVQVSFGGAGPLHGAAIMREVGIRTMLLPPYPGVLCALGCAVANLRYDRSRTVERPLHEVSAADIQDILEQQAQDAMGELEASNVTLTRHHVRHYAKMSYNGQIHTLRVAIESDWSCDQIEAAFETRYRSKYGNVLDGIATTLVGLITTAEGIRPKPPTAETAVPTEARATPTGHRRVWFGEWVDTPIYARTTLRPGMRFAGPAIVEQADTTCVIEQEQEARVDGRNNILIEEA